VALAGDVKEAAYAEALVATTKARFGGLDIAFNNAGSEGLDEAALAELVTRDCMIGVTVAKAGGA
jgi:NAD(P)-dependent dehydrogenase (short-subunit alcohol dehydrogenase family)